MIFYLDFLKYLVFLCLSFICFKSFWKFFFGNSINPFKANKQHVLKRPMTFDRTKRKLLLKKPFRADLVPDDLDAIIIGSGIGGLTCAGLLARCGKRVLVLEQHDRVGGCTHTYKSKGYEFDVGIHYIGNIEPGSMNRCLIDLLTDSQLDWVEIDENFDTIVFNRPGSQVKNYPCLKGTKQFEKQLMAEFPEEEDAIRKYFELLLASRASTTVFVALKILPKFLLKLFIGLKLHKFFLKSYEYITKLSLKDYLDSLTSNDRLKAILSYPFGDYGSAPDESCFFMHSLLVNHLYRKGCFYPVGGASEIAYQIIPGIVRNNGTVLTQAYVDKILIENGVACGVRVIMPNGTSHNIKALNVISGTGVYNTYQKMLTAAERNKFQVMKDLSFIEPGLSCLQIMVGLNATNEELELPQKNYWMFTSDHPGNDLHKYLSLSREDAANTPIPLLFVSFPSAKDPTWNQKFPGKSTCIVVTLSSLAWFEEWKDEKVKKRGIVYDNLKSTFVNQAWTQVLERFPRLRDKVDYIKGGSPLSHAHYLNSVHGEIYGVNHNKERFQVKNAMNMRAETPIPRLFLTGQDIFTCGFMGGAFGGVLSASKAVNRNLLFDWINAVKQERKKMKIKG